MNPHSYPPWILLTPWFVARPVRTAYRTRSAHSRQSGHTPMWQASQSRAYVMR
nr:MAG TPA: hypothetical protein [Caudoviricetes sp.]